MLAEICLLLSVILSLLTYYCSYSYKYKGWQGALGYAVAMLWLFCAVIFKEQSQTKKLWRKITRVSYNQLSPHIGKFCNSSFDFTKELLQLNKVAAVPGVLGREFGGKGFGVDADFL